VALADLVTFGFLVVRGRLWQYYRPSYRNSAKLRELLRFSLPLIPAALLWWVVNVSDRYMVRYFWGDTVNGLYAAAYKIPTLVTLAASVFNSAWKYSVVADANDEERGAFFSTVYRAFLGISFVLSAGLVAFTRHFTRILYSDAFYSAWIYMPVLVLATLFSSMITFLGSVYVAQKKTKDSFLTALLGAALNLLLNLLLIPRIGANGAAIATLVSYAAVFALRLVNTRRYLRFDPRWLQLGGNTLLVGAQVVLMVLEWPEGRLLGLPAWFLVQGAFVVAVLAWNGPDLLRGARMILRSLRRRKA
jgi:O-antigen/teichoic acid export membrane protein